MTLNSVEKELSLSPLTSTTELWTANVTPMDLSVSLVKGSEVNASASSLSSAAPAQLVNLTTTDIQTVGVSNLFLHVLTVLADFSPKWVRLAPNGTSLEFFQIRFQYILAHQI